MDKLFEDFRNDWESMLTAPGMFAAQAARQPLVDMVDNGKEFVIKAEVPGITKDDLKIEVTENSLEMSGETETEKSEEDKETGYVRRERRYSRFHRVLPLPENVKTDKVEAELKDGILQIRLPKATPPAKKSQKVQVK